MTQNLLTKEQVTQFKEEGYVVCESGIKEELLNKLDKELENWIELSRNHDKNFGETMDGKARFDLEVGHTRDVPKLRRVANPADISDNFQQVLWDGPVVDKVAQLIGPSVKFHHCKLNIKLPQMETEVYYHQDHSFDPHTNDDMLAILLMLDDATEENGCLRIVPGTHSERYSHFQNGEYTGAIDPALNSEFDKRAVSIIASRGDVCFMHTWAVHGSQANLSGHPRRLLICDYTCADAYPLLPPAVPSMYTGMVVRGEPCQHARLRYDQIEMRTPYKHDSFFGVQGQPSAS